MRIIKPLSVVFFLVYITLWSAACCPGGFCNQGDKKLGKKDVILPADKEIDSDYFAAGRSVTLSGLVKGDAYLAGGVIDFEGTVEGDLMAAGGEINIRGIVLDDLRLAGGQVIISGEIKGNLTVAGGSVTMTDSAKIDGSLILSGGNVNVYAPVGSNATIGAGKLTIGNKIGGNVKASAGEIKLTSNASIEGDLTYFSGQKAQIQEGAKVLGKVSHKKPPEVSSKKIFGAGFLFYLIFDVLSALLVGLLILKFYPNFINKTVETIQTKSLTSLGVGLLGVIVIPVAFFILMITIIGIPLGIIIMLSYFIYLYITKIFVSLFLGRSLTKLLGYSPRNGWALLIGLIVLALLTAIPFIGGIIFILSVFLGLGALLIFYKQIYSKLKAEKIA